MKVLLDACLPRPLRKFLAAHTVKTAQEMGWGRLKNGALLQAVELEFDAFLNSDRNLKYPTGCLWSKTFNFGFADERLANAQTDGR